MSDVDAFIVKTNKRLEAMEEHIASVQATASRCEAKLNCIYTAIVAVRNESPARALPSEQPSAGQQ
ncbi:MAG: hypothetical protein K2W78_15175 [Xanthobacteraceae bacterium]|nr:hypothetical protein [Xanthobacteraceae bacterium]